MTLRETYTGLYSQQEFLSALNFLGFGPQVRADQKHDKITFSDPGNPKTLIELDTKHLAVHKGEITGGTVTEIHVVINGKDAVTLTGADIDATTLNTALSGDISGLYEALVGDGLHGTLIAQGDKFDNILEIGQGGKATVDAGGGDDVIQIWHSKNAVIDGGTGSDTLEFDSYLGTPPSQTGVAKIDLAAGTGTNPFGGTLTLTNVENIDNFNGVSDISGDGSDNHFRVGTQASTLMGRGGDDEIDIWLHTTVDPRPMVADGGTGKDTLFAELSNAPAAPMTGSGNDLRLHNKLDVQHQDQNTGTFHGGTFTNFEVFRVEGFLNKNVFEFSGSGADEQVYAAGSDDPLDGRGGDDLLFGDLGADILTGGTGADTFQYSDTAQSVANPFLRDTITDFSHAQHDKIDLHLIDADSTGGGINDKFKFMDNKGFDGHAGEVYFDKTGTSTFVFADTNGDKAPDLVILLDDPVNLTKNDFLL
jgi:Ca2+-binding RTX toxin-like protein